MPQYGLTTTGLVVQTLDVIREALNTQLRNRLGASITLDDKSIFGQVTGIFASALADVWEKLEAVNSSQDPDKATGAALEALCALTGTFREAATYSTVTLTLTGTPTTLVASGKKSETDSTHVVFVHLESGTIAALSAWASSTAYALGDRVTKSGNAYQCITAGTSAPGLLDGPSTDDDDITDGTAHWTFLGAGTGAVDVLARAEDVGPLAAFARDVTVRNSSVGGWDGVINLLDATSGRNVASDGELRILREEELATGGSATLNALRAELRDVEGVTAVTIFENTTDTTDGDGIPPHAIEALVSIPAGSDNDQLIFDALLAGKAAGIATHGNTTGSATDDQGTSHVVKFTRPTEVPIYVAITVTVDASTFPSDGADLIKQGIINWGAQQTTGKDAVSSGILAQAFGVEGVLDVTSCLIGTAPSPAASTTIPISLREVATYDTSRISVVTTPGTP